MLMFTLLFHALSLWNLGIFFPLYVAVSLMIVPSLSHVTVLREALCHVTYSSVSLELVDTRETFGSSQSGSLAMVPAGATFSKAKEAASLSGLLL